MLPTDRLDSKLVRSVMEAQRRPLREQEDVADFSALDGLHRLYLDAAVSTRKLRDALAAAEKGSMRGLLDPDTVKLVRKAAAALDDFPDKVVEDVEYAQNQAAALGGKVIEPKTLKDWRL